MGAAAFEEVEKRQAYCDCQIRTESNLNAPLTAQSKNNKHWPDCSLLLRLEMGFTLKALHARRPCLTKALRVHASMFRTWRLPSKLVPTFCSSRRARNRSNQLRGSWAAALPPRAGGARLLLIKSRSFRLRLLQLLLSLLYLKKINKEINLK